MSAADLLVAQKAYSTDLRYHERMARVVEGRGRILIMLALVCLALAASRAADLAFPDLLLSNSVDVVLGRGAAPDQYRYLPHLLMVGLAQVLPFKAAIEVFVFGFLLAFLWMAMFVAWQGRPSIERAACCVFVAMLYPLSMFAGPRFDTALQLAFMLGGLCLWNRPPLYLLLIAVFSLARADYALILALFVLVQAYEAKRLPSAIYGFACCIPLAVQAVMWATFHDATYYTTVFQIAGNMTGDVLRMPGFLYTLGVSALVAAYVRPALRLDRYAIAKLAVLALYILMILLVARAREWRLWLPLLPLVYGLFCGPAMIGRTK